jgi:predicted aldo/keto reductase-like oxidoreductase
LAVPLSTEVTTAPLLADITRDKKELAGSFCRGCGYCLPCPKNIEIPQAARMSLLLRRAPTAGFLSEEWQGKMALIDDCIACGHCKNHCPYGLDTPSLLKENLADYRTFVGK